MIATCCNSTPKFNIYIENYLFYCRFFVPKDSPITQNASLALFVPVTLTMCHLPLMLPTKFIVLNVISCKCVNCIYHIIFKRKLDPNSRDFFKRSIPFPEFLCQNLLWDNEVPLQGSRSNTKEIELVFDLALTLFLYILLKVLDLINPLNMDIAVYYF